MHAYLLIAQKTPDKETIQLLIPKVFHEIVAVSLTSIGEVRTFIKSFTFTPQKDTLYIVLGLGEAKTEAQNAFLKLLEEPPSTTITFLLVVPNVDLLISTILSRVTTIHWKETSGENTAGGTKSIENVYQALATVTDREEASALLQDLLETSITGAEKEQVVLSLEAIKKNGSVPLQVARVLATGLL